MTFNARYRDRLQRLEFTCRNLQKQVKESKSIVDVLSPGQSSTANFDIANKLVNALTLQVAEKEHTISELKTENERLRREAGIGRSNR